MSPQTMQLLGIVFVAFIVIIIGCIFLGIVFIKLISKGKVAAVFFDERRIYSMLTVEDAVNQCIWRGKEDDANREKYKLVADKVFEIRWPSGAPWWMQERLRAWMYTRNNDEPWDPSNMRVTMSARMNRMVSDEALLRTMWKDLRAATGIPGGNGKMPISIILFLGLIALFAGIGMIMTYQASSKISTTYALLKHIYDMMVAAKLIQP